MPSLLTRKRKPDATATYVAVTSFAFASPSAPTSIRRGARLRGDNPIVRATFDAGLWALDGLDDAEMTSAWRALNAPTPTAPAPAPEAARMVRCIHPLVRDLDGDLEQVDVGEVLPATAALVLLFPKNFEPVE